MQVLLSTTYFGPVQWYQKLHRADSVLIERWESFQKQTYRNRCLIATTQGVQALTVPVVRGVVGDLQSPTIKDVRISDHGNWRHLHWMALQSAYGESPFFEYYQDDIRPFFEKRWDYLLDYNEAICNKICELIDILPQIEYTSGFLVEPDNQFDFRSAINPKHPEQDNDFTPKPYYQVYAAKHGFLPNLSVLDLLFNMGPEGIFYL